MIDFGLNDLQLSVAIVQISEYKQRFIQAFEKKDWKTIGWLGLLSLLIVIGVFYTTPLLAVLLGPVASGILGVPLVFGQWLAALIVGGTTRKAITGLEKNVLK